MSLEDTIINDIDVTLATPQNPFTSINTESINIDGLTVFRENDKFYKKDEETGIVSKLSTGNGQVYKWYRIKERDDLVYLDGDLIVDNVIYLNGDVLSNNNISHYTSNIDNTVIKFVGLGFGAVTNNLKDKEVTSDYVVVNDAWKQFNNEQHVFTSKTLIVNGNIYVKNNLDNIVSSNIYITDLKERSFTAEEIILGTNQWKTVDNKLYTDKTVWINGDVIAKGNIYRYCNYYDPVNIDHNVLLPDVAVKIDTVNIKDNLIVNNHKNILKNEQIEISGNDIHFNGSNIYIDGELFFHQKYIQVLKEVYEHTVIYNEAGLMQKRTAFTGQIPIKYGLKHEVGYDIVWTTNPTNYDIFKVSGDIFLADTIKDNGFRIITDFILTINPIDDGFNYPGLDAMFDINNRYSLGILQDVIDVKVTRVSAKHVKLSMNWETRPHYKELYYASMDITAVIPKKLGRRVLITPYHRVYDGDNVEIVELQDTKPFIKLDLSDYDETENDKSNLYYQNVDIANVKILGDGGTNERTSLTVYKTTLDDNIHIAEFWDKNANTDLISHTDCLNCFDDHYGNTVQGVVIGKSGIVCIGIEEKDKEYSVIPDHPNSTLAQVNIMSKDKGINRLKVIGKHNRETIIDNNANLIIGNSKSFNERNSVERPMINDYALDINGHTLITGSLMLNHNNIIRSYFNIKKVEPLRTRVNTIEMYITWEINKIDSYDIYQPINVDIDYYISSIELFPIKTRQQSYNILLNPRNNIESNMPNIITVLEKEGQTTSLYKNLDVIGTREDYNTVKISINSSFATLPTQYPFSSIAYANITITGESLLNQFSVNNKLDFFGILELPYMEDITLLLSVGIYTIDLYSLFNISEIDRVNFEIVEESSTDIMAYMQDDLLKINTNARGIEYNFKIKVLNRRYQEVGIPLTIFITELPTIRPINEYTIHNIQEELIIDSYSINLYQFYNLVTIMDGDELKYSWDSIKTRVKFQSTFSIDDDNAILTIQGFQSGSLKNIEISAYYLNNEGTEYILIDSSFNIQYTEIKKIQCLHVNPVQIILEGTTEITLNLLDYYDSPNTDKILFNYIGIDRQNIITENKNITFDSVDIGKTVKIIGYYDGHYNTTLNEVLIFNIVGSTS
tara:strand:+ start:313 stop:3699 length:3387 start_codon:yes stop_codon:yes gene_type:complete